MRKFMSMVEAKLHTLKNDNTGSDTVEKLGMIVAAVVIICLVLLAINNLFGSQNGIVNMVVQAVQTRFRSALGQTNVGNSTTFNATAGTIT